MIKIDNLERLDNSTKEFINWNNKNVELGKKLENYLDEKRSEWNDKIIPLTRSIQEDPSKLSALQAKCLEYRHLLTDEISAFMIKLSKELTHIKKLNSDRFLFYATGFGLKTNMSEKKILIESELRELQRNRELLDIHLEFLKETRQTCDNINWAIKNKIELYNISN